MRQARPLPQARPTRPSRPAGPDSAPVDRRALVAAALSAVIPGLGQALNRRRRLTIAFLVPSLVLLAIALLVLQLVSTPRLLAAAIAPATLSALLVLDLLLLAWRLTATVQAFFDRRDGVRPGLLGWAGLAVIVAVVALPHALGYEYGTAAERAFAKIFTPFTPEGTTPAGGVAGATATPGATPVRPLPNERINVLLLGVDSTPNRLENLTDTMMVVSLDPVGKTVSMMSVERDIVGAPLGDGNNYGPKLNSLMSYADSHPKDFPQGGKRALADAIGAMLGIDIQYEATIDFHGFMKVIDAVGGVDINVKRGFNDPTYDGYGIGHKGWSVTAGPHHFDGPNALAYARSRKAAGESDFTRQERQQEILVALRQKLTSAGSLLFDLPRLFDALGDTVKTDFPVDELPSVAAVVDEMGPHAITRVVIKPPLVRSGNNRYGSVQIPDLAAIRKVAAGLFTKPGTPPTPWPRPQGSASPAP